MINYQIKHTVLVKRHKRKECPMSGSAGFGVGNRNAQRTAPTHKWKRTNATIRPSPSRAASNLTIASRPSRTATTPMTPPTTTTQWLPPFNLQRRHHLWHFHVDLLLKDEGPDLSPEPEASKWVEVASPPVKIRGNVFRANFELTIFFGAVHYKLSVIH